MNNDLISREALKECARVVFDKDLGRLRVVDVSDIDNAPTVTPDKIQAIMSDYLVYRCEPQRPQGEWIEREDMDYIDENKVVHKYFECKECGLIHDFIDGHTSQYNFCPQCGAKMKGGAE